MKKIVTHDSSFHADDVFAVAVIQMYLDKLGEKYKVIRTRNQEIVENGDFVVDVGQTYDEDMNRFDHHQANFHEKGFLNIPLSSFGLVWKHYGKTLCENNRLVWTKFRNEFVTIFDANDNGINTSKESIPELKPLDPEIFIFSWRPAYNERTEENLYKGFLEAVKFAKGFLERVLRKELLKEEMREEFEQVIKNKKNILKTDSLKALIMPKALPWKDFLEDYEEFDFMVFERDDGNWMAQSVPQEKGSMGVKVLKKSWAGLTGDELSEKVGVRDMVFYHKTGYILVGKTKDSVVEALKKM
jgi:uncharacterized UPF0160 family protein